MFTDLQQKLADELSLALRSNNRFDWVQQVTDFLEPHLMIIPRLFVKCHIIQKDIYWAVYVRKNICEVYKTTQFGWIAGRYSSIQIKLFKGKHEKPADLIIKEIIEVLET
jgi:hypothetical protein